MNTFTRKIFVFGTLFLAFFIFSVDSVLACRCIPPDSAKKAFDKSANVVVLKLEKLEKYADGEKGYSYGGIKQSKLVVEKVFKGTLKVADELTFEQGGGGDCIWTFSKSEIGTSYLFYLGNKSEKKNIWQAHSCSRSSSIDERADDLNYLENLSEVHGKLSFYYSVSQFITESASTKDLVWEFSKFSLY